MRFEKLNDCEPPIKGTDRFDVRHGSPDVASTSFHLVKL